MKDLWKSGGTGIGLWCVMRDPIILEMAGRAGYDYITVDMQHGFNDWSTVTTTLRILRNLPVTVLVRVAANRDELIFRALDLGADGVIIPLVESADDARRAVAACRYPARTPGALGGTRSYGPMWADLDAPGDTDKTGAGVICVVQIETARGLDNVDEIVATPGVDAAYVGPYDLALSTGLGGRTYRDSDEMRERIQRVMDAANNANIVAGMHCDGPEMAAFWQEHGARMITGGLDTTLLFGAYTDRAAAVRSAITAV